MTYEWRPLHAREIDHERLWASIALAGAVLVALTYVSKQFAFPIPLCPLKELTNIPCPTCGGTRALRALSHGALLAALRLNPLVTIGALAAIPLLAYAAATALFNAPRLRFVLSPIDQRLLRIAACTAILANWVFLIVDGR
jgi:hypothetical protein